MKIELENMNKTEILCSLPPMSSTDKYFFLKNIICNLLYVKTPIYRKVS